MSHSVLAPSSAYRWTVCPGSVRLAQQYPETGSSAAAAEGTLAHSHAEHWLRTGQPRDDIPPAMVEPLAMYIADVYSVTLSPQVEQRLDLSMIHPACFGTADAVHRDGHTVYVWDLKFGYQLVEVQNNLQLLCYAAGVAQPGDTIYVIISQPRVWHSQGRTRSFFITYEALTEHIDRLRRAAVLAMSDTAEAVPGTHCTYCPALHVCPAARRVLLDFSQPAQAEPVPDHALAEELRVMRDIERLLRLRIGALEADALQRMRTGSRLPGLSTRRTETRLQWSAPPAEVLAMAAACGYQITKPVTPTQALNSGVPADIVHQYAERKPGAVQLATDCDKQASEVFKNG